MSDAKIQPGALSHGRTLGSNNVPIQVDSSGVVQVSGTISVGGLGIPTWDYMSLAQPIATRDVFTFKSGGSGGTTVATVTINYTDSTHATISTVAKT